MNTSLMLCLHCGRELPFTAEYFPRRGDGLRTQCRQCKNTYNQQWKKDLPLPKRIMDRPKPIETTRICSKCGEEKPLTSEFFRPIAGKMYHRCRICMNKYRTQWRQKNLDKHANYARNYRHSHLDKARQAARTYRHTRADKIREQKRKYYAEWSPEQREYVRQYHRQWKEQNRHRTRAYWHRRRFLVKHAEGSFTGEEILQQLESQEGCCYYCNANIREDYTVDHFIPLSRGGTNWISNIVLACLRCNTSKQDKLPQEWRADLPPTKP